MTEPTQLWQERRPVAMRVLPDRVHYAWWIVVGTAVLMFVTIGVGYYGLAVFLRPLQEENGWSNATVSGATGLFFVLGGIAGFVIGPGVDRRGPLRYINAGVVLMVVSVGSLRFVSEVWHLYLAYTGQALAYGLSGAVTINALMSRWFVTRRAWAMSITFTGVSVGGMVLAPVGTWLVERGGIELAAPILAGLVAVVALPMSMLVLVGDPASVGLGPDADAPNESVRNTALSDEVQLRVWTRAEAMRTGSFWAISVAFVVVLLAQTGFLVHQIAFLEDRLGSRSAAALALSTTAFGSIVARLVVGRFADGMDKRLLTVTIIVVQGLAVMGTTLIDNRITTYVLVLIVGFTIGNVYMMQTLMTAEIFGLVSLGSVLGTMTLMSQVGSGLGPFLVGWAEDVTGSYRIPFVVTGLATIAAAVLILLARPIHSEAPDS
jgi:sugar phosphate permease